MSWRRDLIFVFIFVWYAVCAGFRCYRGECSKDPHTTTNGIYFKLKDKVTGNDILSAGSVSQPVPDTIKLRDLRTGFSYPLSIGLGVNESIIYSLHYQRPSNIIDSLEFKFGNSTPDTIVIYTGMIEGWRGDECPLVKEPGITKVVLRNQVLIETSTDQATFTLRK